MNNWESEIENWERKKVSRQKEDRLIVGVKQFTTLDNAIKGLQEPRIKQVIQRRAPRKN